MKLRLLLLLTMLVGLVGPAVVLAQDDMMVDACEAPMEEDAEMMEVPDNSAISFEIILPNPRGDRSFIDSAAAGAERAIAELGVEGRYH